CLGWPRRREPPAARTKPVMNTSLPLPSSGVTLDVTLTATRAAEPQVRTVDGQMRRVGRDGHGHATDRVDGLRLRTRRGPAGTRVGAPRCRGQSAGAD